ncbi:MAG: RluA family pseudouridine synthase [Bacilli bacterium]|nr:RluA family pseudouridine synthase [Bacilli bacterium]
MGLKYIKVKNNINILFEDNHLLVVEKPINMPVQEDSSKDNDLLNILKEYIKEKYNKPGNVYLGLVHRLDRPVGGVMVFAKTSKCASRLSEQIRLNKFNKIYNAVVMNKVKENKRLENYLLKDTKNNIVKVDKSGKLSILEYKRLDYKDNMSLIEIKLFTGRSHQIRVQLSYDGNPLYGDQKYNKDAKVGEQLALFARRLEFYHPISKELLTFELPLPDRKPFNIFKG